MTKHIDIGIHSNRDFCSKILERTTRWVVIKISSKMKKCIIFL